MQSRSTFTKSQKIGFITQTDSWEFYTTEIVMVLDPNDANVSPFAIAIAHEFSL